MGGWIEVLFPIAEVNDPPTKAWFVDGGANQSWSPIAGSGGSYAPGAIPHQIGTDKLLPASPPPPPPPPVTPPTGCSGPACPPQHGSSQGGTWNPSLIFHSQPPVNSSPFLGVVTNGNQDFYGLTDGIFAFTEVGSTTSHDSGRYYFEIQSIQSNDVTAYAIDFDNRLMWARNMGNPAAGGTGTSVWLAAGPGGQALCGLATLDYLQAAADGSGGTAVGQIGSDTRSLGVGAPFYTLNFGFWYNGAKVQDFIGGEIAGGWNGGGFDPTVSDPNTGIGGFDFSFLAGGPFYIGFSMGWIVGDLSTGIGTQTIRLRTASNGTIFPPPMCFDLW